MSEENKMPANAPLPPPPPPPPPPAGQSAELQAELLKVRSGNKILKIAAMVLATLFVLMAGAAFYIYKQIEQTKAALAEAFQATPAPFPNYIPENRTLPSGGASVFGGGAMPASSLGLISGSVPGASQAAFSPEAGEQITAAMNKYADRPIVKEFIADLKKNPAMARAFEDSKGGNPMKVMASIQGAKGMDKIIAKYAMRPEFLKLMAEVMNDPAMKPFLRGMPGGMPFGGGAAQPPNAAPEMPAAPADPAEETPMTLDSSAVSGDPAAAPVPAKRKKVPPPVDTE
jgi:hypothetical protein